MSDLASWMFTVVDHSLRSQLSRTHTHSNMPIDPPREEVLYEVNGFWLNFQNVETETEFVLNHTKFHQAPAKVLTLVWAIIVTVGYTIHRSKSLGGHPDCNFGIISIWAMVTFLFCSWSLAIFVQVVSRSTTTRPLMWQVIGTLFLLSQTATFFTSKTVCLAYDKQNLFAGTVILQIQEMSIGIVVFLAAYTVVPLDLLFCSVLYLLPCK